MSYIPFGLVVVLLLQLLSPAAALNARYQVETADNLIVLEGVHGLSRVACTNSSVTLSFKTADDAAIVQDWTIGSIIAGAKHIRCHNVKHEKSFHRLVQRINVVDEKTVEISTSDASFFDCFKKANVMLVNELTASGDKKGKKPIVNPNAVLPVPTNKRIPISNSGPCTLEVLSPQPFSHLSHGYHPIVFNTSCSLETVNIVLCHTTECEASNQTPVALNIPVSLDMSNNKYYYPWTAPSSISEGTYFIRVQSAEAVAQTLGVNFLGFTGSMAFTSPTQDTSVNAGSDMTLTWERNGVSSTKKLTVKLFQQYWLSSDQQVGEWDNVENTGSFSLTLPSNVQPSMHPLYFKIEYKDLWLVPISIQSDYFMMPQSGTKDFNYNPVTGHASGPLPVFHRSCDDRCPACQSNPDSCNAVDKAFCALCGGGRSLSLDLACSDCYAHMTYAVSKLYLTHDGLHPEINFQASGSADLNLDLTAVIDFDQAYQHRWNLANHVPIVEEGFSVAGVHLDLGLFFDLDMTINFDFHSKGQVTTGGHATVNFDVSLVHNPNEQSFEHHVTPNFQFHSPTWQLDAGIKVDAGLVPSFSASVGDLAKADITAEPFLLFNADLSYPPFAPLAGDYNPPQGNALFHEGSCNNDHLVEYALVTGIRNAQADASLHLTVLGTTLVDKQWHEPIPDTPQLPLLAGCLFNVPTTDNMIPLRLKHSFNGLTDLPTLNSYVYAMAADVAKALDVPQYRFHFQTIENQGTDASTTTLFLLPGTNTSEASISDLHQQVLNALRDSSNAIYQGQYTQYIDPASVPAQ